MMMAQASPMMVAAPQTFRCPVCDGVDFGPMFRGGRTRMDRRAHAPYRITQSSRALVGAIEKCRACGLGVLPPELIEARHYADGADERFAEQGAVRIRNAERLLRLLPRPGHGPTLLDVGSAYGFLLVAARGLGYAPVGVELSQEAAAHARRAYGLEVWTGTVENAPFNAGSFDVITLCDVIEHLADPASTIRRLQYLLRPNGRLLILTPNLDSLAARTLGRHWWGLLDYHCFYFSRRTLPRFLARHGFATERLQSFGRVFPMSHWIFKLSQYHHGVYRVLDRMMRAARLTEIEVPVNLGDQMVCLARRSPRDAQAGE